MRYLRIIQWLLAGLWLFALLMIVYQWYYPKQAPEITRPPPAANIGPLLQADKVLVKKQQRRLYLLKEEKAFREYHIALGGNPSGHKRAEGDQKTPEGDYILDWRNPNSIAYKSLHVSYPNSADKTWAKKHQVDPGGNIMIHGVLNRFAEKGEWLQQRDWTDGCIAVLDKDMEEIWQSVKIGTPITILP